MIIYQPRREKPVFGISGQVRQKPVCAVTGDGYKVEMLDLRRSECTINLAKSKALNSYCTADMCLLFSHRHKSGFLMNESQGVTL